MNKRPSIVGLGICVVDIYRHRKKMYPGGNEYNVAYNAGKMGADSAFMGVFADDRIGEILENTLIEAGIDTGYCHHRHGSSGYAIVDLVDGDRVFVDWNRRGVTDIYPFDLTEEEISYLKTFDIVSMSKNSRLNYNKIERLAENGADISYDFNDNFTDEDIRRISPLIKIGFFSCSHMEDEETKNVLRRCVELGCGVAIATRGSRVVIAYDGSQYYFCDVVNVKATDTMGAGDAFISSFLMNYLSAEADESIAVDNNIYTSMKAACKYAAEVVVKDGSLGVGYDVDPERLSEIINI